MRFPPPLLAAILFLVAAGLPGRADEPPHWAFVSPRAVSLPAVGDAAWPLNEIDRFILADLEKHKLRPAARADKRALLRRATFDLIGLPPTPAEIEAFLADNSPGAFARVVDRLLASPHYGERWGRHWLDVVRYADSNGLDENLAHGNAWRYRDYVVAALNQDKPYDQFLLEQIAGDLLPGGDEAARIERRIATGYLVLGPKVLAEVDEKKMEMDIIDEQISALGQGVLALTLGCARCHDHKFDPVTAEDYYALAGIFQSTRTMENFKKVARWNEFSLASPAEQAQVREHTQKVTQHKKAIDDLAQKIKKMSDDQAKARIAKLRESLVQLEKAAPDPASAMAVAEGPVSDSPILRRGNHLAPGKPVPRRFPAILTRAGAPTPGPGQSGRLELARWLVHRENPLTSRVIVNRLWRWHFGQGLVRSVDNFGLLGDAPTHPALLDWLALRLVHDGWSLKATHRLVMLSATYAQACQGDPRGREVDPENRLVGRASVRRLEAEAIRDSLLVMGDMLDRRLGGSLLHVKNREWLFDHTSLDKSRYDAPRRSLYLPVVRNNLYDVYQLFDATDATVPNGNRTEATVATQALFVLNSDLVVRAAEHLASRVLAASGDDERAGLRLLCETVYGRAPTEAELDRWRRGLAKFDQQLRNPPQNDAKSRARSWALLCHVLLASNEFLYLN